MQERYGNPQFTTDQLHSMQVGGEALTIIRGRVGDLEPITEDDDGTAVEFMGVADDYKIVDGYERKTRMAYFEMEDDLAIIGETFMGKENPYVFGEKLPEEYHGLPVEMKGIMFEQREPDDTNITEIRTDFFEITHPDLEGGAVLVREVYGDPVADFVPVTPAMAEMLKNRMDDMNLLGMPTGDGELFEEIADEPVLSCARQKLIEGPRVLSGAEAEEVLGYIRSSVETALSQQAAEYLDQS